MKKFKDWLLKDLWLKVVSILLAIVIWFVWIQIENPTISKDFSNVKVSIINQDALNPEQKVWEILDRSDTLKVTVTAPKTVINSLSSSDIIAEADANKMEDGELPISLHLAGDQTYDSLVANRETLSISIEDRVRKYVRVIQSTTGEVAENYKFGGITMDLNMIEITGPRSDVERVSYGEVEIDIDGVSESLSANIEIQLYDASNEPLNLSSITKQSDYVHVDVNILPTKTIPIYASKTGEPANGYLYAGNLEVTPEVVTIAGTNANLQGISRINIEEPVDISGATDNVSKTVNISSYLPENVTFGDDNYNGDVTITVFVEPEVSKKMYIDESAIVFTNIPEGMEITAGYGDIAVEISGLASDIEEITGENIGVTVDVAKYMDNNNLKDLTDGAHMMPLTLGVSGSVEVKNSPTVNATVSHK
jgi:YbbR domain-containing protein